MPKSPQLPLNGLFPIEKPTGPTSMKVLDDISPLLCDSKLFYDSERVRHHSGKGKRKKNTTDKGVKIGQGGTLDPLADGVLVVGVNRGTKHLQSYLDGTKEYEAIGLLGAATTTMDAEGPVLTTGDFDNITREDIEEQLKKFNGTIIQTPPIFSALKMEGKPLYEYARENKPLPRAIPTRSIKVSCELLEFTPASSAEEPNGHDYHWPTERLSEEQKTVFRRLTELVHDTQQAASSSSSTTTETPLPKIGVEYPEVSEKTGKRPATFRIRMTVSGGTYVRSIVHDLGLALGCGAHVVLLRRTRQGQFVLREEDAVEVNSENNASKGQGKGTTSEENGDIRETGQRVACIPWSIWQRAIAEREKMISEENEEKEQMMANGASPEKLRFAFSYEALRKRRMDRPEQEWEKAVLAKFQAVHVPPSGGHSHHRPPYT